MAKKLKNSQLKIKTNVWFSVCIEKRVRIIQRLLYTKLEGYLCAMKLEEGIYLLFHKQTDFSATIHNDIFNMLSVSRQANGSIKYHDVDVRQRSNQGICKHLNI